MASENLDQVRSILRAHGIGHVGVAPATVLDRARAALIDRRASGLADRMQFTYRNPQRSTDPDRVVPGARSIIAAALTYHTDPPAASDPSRSGRVARYARADHYGLLWVALGEVADRLEADGHRAKVLVDDNAIVDREVAWLAGLGWFGKNANLLISGAGSHFVLGCVVTTADLLDEVVEPVADGCGPCTRCLDGCPTGAIVRPGVVDAGRCLAWLLQRDGTFPLEFREALGDRIYGCDDCQEVCPPTVRLGRRWPTGLDAEAGAVVDVVEMLDPDDDRLLERFGRWYIAQRDPRWLRRNAIVVLGNIADPDDLEVRDRLTEFVDGDDDFLAEHARWALGRIDRRRMSIAVGRR